MLAVPSCSVIKALGGLSNSKAGIDWSKVHHVVGAKQCQTHHVVYKQCAAPGGATKLL